MASASSLESQSTTGSAHDNHNLVERILLRSQIVARKLAPPDHPVESIQKVIQQKLPHLFNSTKSNPFKSNEFQSQSVSGSGSGSGSPETSSLLSNPSDSISNLIDHTLLSPPITDETIIHLCHQSISYQFYSICIPPASIRLAYQFFNQNIPPCQRPTHRRPKICTVIGFPLGYNTPAIKKEEARMALLDGADELDLVLNAGDLKQGNYQKIAEEIHDVVIEAKEEEERRRKRNQSELIGSRPSPSPLPLPADSISCSSSLLLSPIVVKVILETGLLSSDEMIDACLLCALSEASFVKTSTGFSSAGGATVEAVRLMKAVVGEKLGVKASGGIRDFITAKKMIEAGATRLGLSSSIAIVEQERESRGVGHNVTSTSSPSTAATNSSPTTY